MSGAGAEETRDDGGGSNRTWRMSRRGFLIGAAITGVALAVGIPMGLPPAPQEGCRDHGGRRDGNAGQRP